ncbi:MAG: hypothetical protein OCU18_05775 [Candidatus Syntrophoarchaeum sp.]|nr:hypothetical protein [Candidatus Syntrophoarchaeum sp.]
MGDTKLLKLMLLAMGLVGVVLIVMPQTVSLFAGEHTWYNLSGGGNDLPCEKCHGDIAAEYQEATAHPKLAPHKTYPCTHCHRISGFGENNGTQIIYASGDGTGSTPGNQTHAAVATLSCMDCHDMNFYGKPLNTSTMVHHYFNPEYATCGWGGYPDGPRNCHAPPRCGWGIYIIRAGGFGLTDYANRSGYYHKPGVGWPEDTGEKAAHKQFVLDAINDSLMNDADEACIACHTEKQVRMEFNVSTGAIFTVNNSYTQTSSYWSVSDITPTNYTTYVEVKN